MVRESDVNAYIAYIGSGTLVPNQLAGRLGTNVDWRDALPMDLPTVWVGASVVVWSIPSFRRRMHKLVDPVAVIQ